MQLNFMLNLSILKCPSFFCRYEPLRLSRAVDLWTASEVSGSLYGPRRLHACMHTCPLICVTRNLRCVLPCYSCEAVSHCDSQRVRTLFGKSNVPRLVITKPQCVRPHGEANWRGAAPRIDQNKNPTQLDQILTIYLGIWELTFCKISRKSMVSFFHN